MLYDSKQHKLQVLSRSRELLSQLLSVMGCGEFEMILRIARDLADQLVIVKDREIQDLFFQTLTIIRANIYKTKKSQRTIFALDTIEDIGQVMQSV
jgi:hypothetical protein